MKQNRQKLNTTESIKYENEYSDNTHQHQPQPSRTVQTEKQPKLLNTNSISNGIRKDWHFNLRRINSNRATYLDYKQKQQDENHLANDYAYLIKKENVEEDFRKFSASLTTSSTASELDYQMASFNLINKSAQLPSRFKNNSINLNENFDFASFKFDLNSSLVDQVNQASLISSDLTSVNKLTESTENSTPFTNQLKTCSQSFNEFLIPISETKNNITVDTEQSYSCVYEYLHKTGGNAVPNDCFQHVIAQLKQTKHLINISTPTSGNISSLNNSNSKSTSISNFFKCEYIYGENFYWVVKIKRFYEALYQIKFFRNLQYTKLCNNSELEPHVQPQTPSAPTSPSISSSINSSLNKTSNEECNSSRSHTNSNLSQSFFFTFESSQFHSQCLSSEFFKNLRPLGWSKSHGRQAQKPVEFTLENSYQMSASDFDANELTSFFKLNDSNESPFEENSKCELQHDLKVHICNIKRNISGRLLIEINKSSPHIWIFYLDPRLHLLGWAKDNNIIYDESCHNIDFLLNKTDMNNSHDHELRQKHHFKRNYLMECLYKNKFYVAKVVEILNDNCFKIELDSFEMNKMITFYSSNSTSLFPCKWCKQNNLKLETPSGWPRDKPFDWDSYLAILNEKSELKHTLTIELDLFNWSRNLNQLSDRFQLGMYLECVDPSVETTDSQENSVIRLGQIRAKLAHLIFVKIISNYDSISEQLRDDSFCVYTVDSYDLYPIGWCEMNNYYGDKQTHLKFYKYPIHLSNQEYLKRIQMRSDLLHLNLLAKFKDKENWCDKIYLNLNCNCGTYFSKSKLKTLPKFFGPGPIFLVVTKIIQMLISKSEKPFKTLKQLQAYRRTLNNSNNLNSVTNVNTEKTLSQIVKSKNMQRVRLKAKEKGKYLFREIEVCTRLSQLNEYLNDLCNKLKCCPKMLTYTNDLYIKSNEPMKSNSICIDFKCCLYCTINYYSLYSNSCSQQNLLEQQAKAIFAKQISLPVKKPISQITNNSTKPICNHSANDLISNYSPIKTRLNVRQSLLHSLKKQQQIEQQTVKIEKEKEKQTSTNNDQDQEYLKEKFSRKLHLNQRDASNEPTVKKARKFKHLDQKQITSDQSDFKNEIKKPETTHSAETKPANENTASTSFMPSSSVVSSANNSILNKTESNNNNNKNSYISNANMSKIISSNLNSNNLNRFNGNDLSLSQHIASNPLYWNTNEVCNYLLENKFDPNLTNLIREHEIDGQSFLMLNLPTIQNYMNLKLGPAIKLAHLVERLKFNYFQQFQTVSQLSDN